MDTFGIGDCVDLEDLSVSDGEAQNGVGASLHGDNHPSPSVDQRWVKLRAWERAQDRLPREDFLDAQAELASTRRLVSAKQP